VDGLLLPKTLKWRSYENSVVGEIKSERSFVNASVSKEKVAPSFFKKPEEQK